MSLPSLRLRVSSLFFVAVLAGGGFVLSSWSEHRFQALPLVDQPAVELVMDAGVEGRLSTEMEWAPLTPDVVLAPGTSFRTSEQGELGLLLKGGDLIRLYPSTEIEILEIDFASNPLRLTVALRSGSLWVSDVQGLADLTVQTRFSRVEPEEASAAVSYDGERVNVFAAHHPVRFSFLAPEMTVLNDYLLTESHQLSVAESTFTSTIQQLRTTKLVKDYPFEYREADQWDPTWRSALNADVDRLRQTYQAFVSFLRRQGSGGYASDSWTGRMARFYDTLRQQFALQEDHRRELKEAQGLELLYQALYLTLEGDQTEAIDRLQQLESLPEIASLYPVFQSVNVNHAFYPYKELIRTLSVQTALEDERLSRELFFLRQRLNEIYDLLDEGDLSDARQALLAYSRAWQALMDTHGSALAHAVQTLTEERQILQNLLYREVVFYELDSYAVLSALEDHILNLTGGEYDLNEERAAFVKDKIAVLGRLVEAIDEGRVSLREGTTLAHHLIDESQTLMQAITVQVAIVSDFFVPELSELTLKFQFLNSPDYLLGDGTLAQKFEDYLSKQQDLKELTDYLAGLRQFSSSESSVTLDEALNEVKADLEAVRVSYLALLPLGDADYRLFEIEGGSGATIQFHANYDRGTQIVYDLQVEGAVFSSGVKLDKLIPTLQQALIETSVDEPDPPSMPEVPPSTVSPLSPVESVAISLLRHTLDLETDLDFSGAQISIIDLDAHLFKVVFSFQENGETFEVRFSYAGDEDLAFDVTAVVEETVFEVEEVEPALLREQILETYRAGL